MSKPGTSRRSTIRRKPAGTVARAQQPAKSGKAKPAPDTWAAFDALDDKDITQVIVDDPDAAPIGDDDFWKNATVVLPVAKQAVSIRLDEDVLAFFKSTGPGYQSRINAVLRSYMNAKQ